jgi:6-pyruvoyltetrahydropterin/6-carboxytetrahydropterin synthase
LNLNAQGRQPLGSFLRSRFKLPHHPDFRLHFHCRLGGAKIAGLMFVRLTKSFAFEAAHHLPTFPAQHKCRRLHGHSFRFDLIVEGEVDPQKGYLVDYGYIKRIADPFVQQLDHNYLNEIEGLSNPTSENIAHWLWEKLKPILPQLAAVIVHETCTSVCEYRGN